MQKLTNSHTKEVLQYLSAEPEFNLFLIGDIEQFGMESDQVSCYTADNWQPGTVFPYFILDYRGNFLVYSHTDACNYKEIADFLQAAHFQNLSGRNERITPLLSFMEEKNVIPTYLAKLDHMAPAPADAAKPDVSKPHPVSGVRRLTEEDIPAIYDLYVQIDEFAYTYRDRPKEQVFDDIRQNVSVLGRTYGIFEGDTLLSVAQTSAENSISAMVIGVATLPAKRGCGYAKAVVTKLCQDCLQDGMKFLCLFYSNPAAGRIYRSIGFQEMGIYTMVRSR
ncbi:MAG: GNAT family N-acetyltransferase [Lachnospiraceae bacterium]|nr:GNAT family N-acetyltransferase [Lachnospiraceae bacterium]